jgi:hypothetical protein
MTIGMKSKITFSLPRPAMIILSLSVILGLQLAITLPKINLPFLDGRMHYYYDNAYFTYMARNGILVNQPKTQFGITELPHSAWGKPAGEASFYTHHPFLFKAIFQQYVRFLGDEEWVSRSFALGVAIIASLGIFAGLLIASESVLSAFSGSVVMVGIPVLAIFQSCLKYEIDGMAAGSWFFVALALYLKRPNRRRLATVTVLALISALAHWTALIFVIVSIFWLVCERIWKRDLDASRAALSSGVGAAAGTAMVFGIFAWLKGGWNLFLADIVGTAAYRSHLMQQGSWAQRQLFYMAINFGKILPWVCGFLGIGLAARWIWFRVTDKTSAVNQAKDHLLPAFFFCTLTTACIWQFGFRQGSYIHIFWQLWFCLPVAGLVAMGMTAARGNSKPVSFAAILGCVILAGWLQISSYSYYRTVLTEPLGTPQDVEFLKSLRNDPFRRFVFLPITQEPMNDWFQGPIFEYYTDRQVEYFNMLKPPGPGDEVLMLIYNDQKRLVQEIGRRLALGFVNEKCGYNFCAYDLIKR